MGAPDILARLHAVGVNLSRRGDKLVATPKAAVTPEVLDLLRAHKPELLAALEAPTVHQPPSVASQAELQSLVRLFASVEGFTEQQTGEALQTALDNPEHSTAFYRDKRLVPDPRAEVRRTRVLKMLEDHPTARYALVTDTEADPEAVILALAIRGEASCEFQIPHEKWDGVLFLDLLEKHGQAIH